MGGKLWSACDAPTQRLSKPRTNTSSSNLLSLSSQRSEPSSPVSPTNGAMGESPVVTSQTGECRSRRKSRSKIRSFLHGPGNEVALAQSSDEEDNTQQGFVNGIRKRMSRGNSSSSQYVRTRKSSTQLSNASNSRLVLDDDGTSRIKHDLKEREYVDRIAAQNHVPAPADEDNCAYGTQAPIRRRSLYTPGLATRTPHDILRRPPPADRAESETLRQYSCNPDRSHSSPHVSDLVALAESRNTALASSQDGRSTPVGFSQLGGLSLGTLRITNGAASPEPSMRASGKAMSDCASHEDYFTASEGCKSDDERRSLEAVDETPRPIRRADSPLKYESHLEDDSTDDPLSLPRVSEPLLEPKYRIYPENGLHNRKAGTPSKSQTNACSMAQDYMSEMPPSPYGPVTPTQGHSTTQSTDMRPVGVPNKDQASRSSDGSNRYYHDEGVDVADAQSSHHGDWRNGIDDAEAEQANSRTKEDAYRILNGDILPRISSSAKKSYRVDLTSGDRDTEDRRESSATTTTTNTMPSVSGSTNGQSLSKQTSADKNDSGYSSSNVSLTKNEDACDRPNSSLHMPQQPLRGPEAFPATPQISGTPIRPSLTVVRRPATTVTVTTTTSLPAPQRQYTAPTVHPSSTVPMIAGGQSYHLPVKKPPAETSRRHSAALPLTKKEAREPVTDYIDSKSRRLQKVRRISATRPADQLAAQQLRDITEVNIPPIPPEIASKHAARLRDFPSLEHTYPSLHHTRSDTCWTPTPECTNFLPIRFPSPASSMEDRSDAIVNGNLDWPTKASKKKAKELAKEQSARSSKGDRRKSRSEPEGSIADFGDIGNFLGKSLYDIAKASISQVSQPGNSKKRDPAENSTSAEVTEDGYQRAKSIFRPPTPGRERPSETMNARTGRPRPKSMFVESAHGPHLDESRRIRAGDDSGEPSSIVQSRFSYAGAPPVPLLASGVEARQQELEVRKNSRSEGPRVPDGSLTGDFLQTSALNARPTKPVRPQSMYDIDTEAMRKHMQRVQTHNGARDASKFTEDLDICQPAQPQNNNPSSQLGRSETVIHHGTATDRSVRPQTTPACAEAQPALPPVGDLDQWLRHYVRNENRSQFNALQGRPESEVPICASPVSENREDMRSSTQSSRALANKLQKRRPDSVKPDIWKSDSLKDELSKRSTETEQRPDSKSGSDSLRVSQVARPVAAPSLHDALRAHEWKTSHSPNEPPLPSRQQTPLESTQYSVKPQATSAVQQPPTNLENNTPEAFPPEPTREAPRSSPKPQNGIAVEPQQPAASTPQTPKKSSNSSSLNPTSSPRTPRSSRPSSQHRSPQISIPTATAAESYTSTAAGAPAPPAFSIPRKRIGSLPSHDPTRSARSLKPVAVYTPTGTTSSATASPSPQNSLNPPPSSSPSHRTVTPDTTTIDPPYQQTRFENLSGRYQGGLLYGYEPGIGLGGSAGTRSVVQNGAARKSVDVSKGFGLDLSDVPVFVAPVVGWQKR